MLRTRPCMRIEDGRTKIEDDGRKTARCVDRACHTSPTCRDSANFRRVVWPNLRFLASTTMEFGRRANASMTRTSTSHDARRSPSPWGEGSGVRGCLAARDRYLQRFLPWKSSGGNHRPQRLPAPLTPGPSPQRRRETRQNRFEIHAIRRVATGAQRRWRSCRPGCRGTFRAIDAEFSSKDMTR